MALHVGVEQPAAVEDWTTAAHRSAEAVADRLERQGAALVAAVAAATAELGAGGRVAASELGARLIEDGAGEIDDGPAAIVEGYLATGVQILRAANRVREAGGTVAGAIAVSADPAGADFVRRELGAPLIVLDSGAAAD